MRLRCALLDDYQGVGTDMADWSALDLDVFSVREHPQDESTLVDVLEDCDLAVTLRERVRFTESTFARLPRLKLLVASGMRNAAIDLEAARRHGVTVCGTGSHSTPPVELTWALILGLLRHIVPENEALRAGAAWQSTVGSDLHGRTLGLLGLGKVGGGVAAVGSAFGMDVRAWSANLTDERAAEVGVTRCDTMDELLAVSDLVSIHLVLSERTRNLIGRRELELMRPGSFLVNTARAGIVDQDALLEALHAGRLGGAGVDVFDTEPLPFDHPMRTAPRLLATPHLGYVTELNYRRYYAEAVENIRAYLAGTPHRVLGA